MYEKGGLVGILRFGFAIFLLFAFLAIDAHAQPPDFPQPDIRKEETHEGDLVLTGTQVMTIEHTKLKINGNISVSGNARLIIRSPLSRSIIILARKSFCRTRPL